MNFSRRNFIVAATAFAASSSTAASAISSSPFGVGGVLPELRQGRAALDALIARADVK